jgi:NTE family protein
VMATSAYPGVFAAQEINGKWYIDGGTTRNLPAEDARIAGADFIIGSSIYAVDGISDKEAGQMNRFETVGRALDIFEKELSRFHETQCDFCFKPRVDQYRWFDFFKMREIAAQGRANAAQELKKLLPMLKNEAGA